MEGLAAEEYFKKHGYEQVQIFDQKDGLDYLEKACECDVLLRSPGVHVQKIMDALVKSGRQNKVEVTSTTQFFMENCPCPIIGVTGTKGKGTTSTLITLMLKEAGFEAYLGGNIGQSPLEFLDELKPNSWVVLEMSSFQLQDLEVSPHVAVVLHVSSDHLDYHKDVNEYREAKSAIVKFQGANDVAVFNEDYSETKDYASLTKAQILTVSRQHEVESGAFIKRGVEGGGEIMFRLGKSSPAEKIGEVSKVALIGAHHLENVLPAVTVARNLNLPISAIQKVLYSFAGLPHRLEFAKEIDGVKYYNDSFSTTPDTSIAATYAFNKPVILIAGGSEKFADYTEWGMELQKNPLLKMVLLMGTTAPRMKQALEKAGNLRDSAATVGNLQIVDCADLKDALNQAKKSAIAGDVVVMSPAAASFDQFKNYKERGQKFKSIVEKLN